MSGDANEEAEAGAGHTDPAEGPHRVGETRRTAAVEKKDKAPKDRSEVAPCAHDASCGTLVLGLEIGYNGVDGTARTLVEYGEELKHRDGGC